MSHDLFASLAASEIALLARTESERFFTRPVPAGSLSSYAVREGRSAWPIPDGVITLENAPARKTFSVALEFKRKNEGLHGTLTALGQAHAYLYKGFAGSVIVIPEQYDTHPSPGAHLKSIVEELSNNLPIAVVTYKDPDTARSRPFESRLSFVRDLNLGDTPPAPRGSLGKATPTQWVHLRAGQWYPDLVRRYLQVATELAYIKDVDTKPSFPAPMVSAVGRIAPGVEPAVFLSSSPVGSSSFHDRVWRRFWFTYVFHRANWQIWSRKNAGVYECNMAPTKLLQPDGSQCVLFCNRIDSIRRKLTQELNAGSITEADAWDKYVMYIGGSRRPGDTNRGRAHSYREDADSFIEGLEFIDAEGEPTALGQRFLSECKRSGESNSGAAKMVFSAALLRNGNFGALAHFVYRLSEQKFEADPLAFAKRNARGHLVKDATGRPRFDQASYTNWLWTSLSEELGVLRTTSSRRGGTRGKLLDEFRVMKFLGFTTSGYRVGVGLPLNWAAIQQALDFPID